MLRSGLLAAARYYRLSKMACHEQIFFSLVEKNMRRVAEREGFEPPVSLPTRAFQARAFSRSAISPIGIARNSMREFRLTTTEKRGFRLSHGDYC